MNIYDTQEGIRLQMTRQRIGHWNRWGPFVAERAWGTVREDYSADGDAWNYFPHDHARSRAIAGTRMASPASAIGTSTCVSRWRCGTGAIRI